LYYDTAYAPYGENYAGSGTTDLSFTGQNQDTVPGMYDFLYREYHPNQGRWISPDPAGTGAVDTTNPQTWNRYGYVANSPTGGVDRLGLCPAWSIPGHCLEVQQSYDWLIGNSGVTIDGIGVDPGMAAAFLQSGVAGVCPDGNCGAITTDPNTGQLVQYIPHGASSDDGGWTIKTGNGQWVQINPASELAFINLVGAANNQSYAWTFTKAFFKNFSLKAVYNSFGEGGCDRLMAETFAGDFVPFPTEDTPGPADAVEPAAKFLSAVTYNQALERVSQIGSASHQVLMCKAGEGLSFCHEGSTEAVER
jgi:RHS repeat-associated protein